MDAPDPVVRSAMAKVMNPQGLPPMTQKELNRLLGRQYLEAQDQKTQANNASLQTQRVRQAISSGDMPPIDVRQYSGSMYAPQGSYSEARTLAPTRVSAIERSADQLLKARFGQMAPGQMSVAPYTSPSTPSQPAPQAGYGYIQGRDDYLGTTPSGMVRSAEPVLGDQFQQLSGAMQPSQQAGAPKSPWDALPPVQPALMQPTAVAQPAPTQTPTAPQPSTQQAPLPASLGRALDQLIGARPMSAPPAVTQQTPTEVTPSNIFSFSPVALNLANEQRELSRRQAEDQRKMIEEKTKKDLAAARSSFAVGQPLPANIQLNTSQIYEAYIGGMEDRKRGLTTVRMDKDVNGKMVPVDVTTNPLTGERYEAQVQRPVLSAQEQADLEDKKIRMAQGAKEIEKVDTDLQFARKQAELANQITNAIAQGATTGLLAETASTFKSIGEALLDGEYGATNQKLYVQAVQGMSLNQVTNVMRGLGAMSDTDRVAAEKAFVSIRDPKMAVLYYAELSRLNYERAQARQELVDRLTDSGATSDKIRTELSKMKRAEPFLSEVAFKNLKLDRVVANQKSGGMTRLPSSPRGNVKPNNGVEGFIIVDEQP